MHKLFVVLCLLVCSSAGNTQLKSKKPLSALLKDLSTTKPDSGRVYVLLQIANYYLERVPLTEHKMDSALPYIHAADKITKSQQLTVLKQEAAHCLAKYYLNTGRTEVGKTIILGMINDDRASGNRDDEIRWLTDLENHIAFDDTAGVSKLECLQRVVILNDPVQHRKERIKAELALGHYYYRMGNWDTAEHLISKTLGYYQVQDPELLWNSYYELSEVSRYKGNLNKALMYALKSLKVAEQMDSVYDRDYLFGQLGLIYQDLGLSENSIEWFQKALDIRMRDNQSPYIIYRTAGFLVQQLISQQNVTAAAKIINHVVNQTLPISDFDSATLFQLKANYYNSIKRFDLAELYYQKMIESKGIVPKNPEISVIAYQDIGEFYMQRVQYDKAKRYLVKALEVEYSASTPSRIRDIHLALYKVDSSLGRYLSAFKHMHQYRNLNDSLFNASKTRQIEELKIQYETDKISQNNKLLAKEARLQQTRLSQANTSRNWILGALVTMFVFLALLLYNTRLKQRTNRILKMQQGEISRKNDSLNHLITEKEWLIKEIHHRVKNNFHMVIGLLDTQSGYLKNPEALTAIKESQHRIQAMAFIHQKLYQSTNLSSVEMSDYIHELVDYLKHSFVTRDQVIFRLDIMHLSLNLSHALPLALILNEAITNSIKYAFPSVKSGTITISLKKVQNNRFSLAIADNGAGMKTGFAYQSFDTMGMKLIQGLCEDIHGRMEIQNMGGTTILIHFQYDDPLLKDIAINSQSITTE